MAKPTLLLKERFEYTLRSSSESTRHTVAINAAPMRRWYDTGQEHLQGFDALILHQMADAATLFALRQAKEQGQSLARCKTVLRHKIDGESKAARRLFVAGDA